MAIIYGRAETEKDLLDLAPDSITKVEDIETVHQELKDQLANDKKDFFEKLPSKIKEEEQELEKIKNNENKTIQKYEEKVKNLEKKKSQGGFSAISSSLKISFAKNISKRREINRIKDLEKKQLSQLSMWKENPDRIFNNTQTDKINEIKEIDELKEDPLHAGAKGELLALEKLSELSDDYHVFCGVRAELPYYVTYNGKKNLKSAQLDFVVVSKKGIILIEVKNWSNQYCNRHKDLSPHEQVDRAGRVLWIAIKSRWGWWKTQYPRVTNVLLSIQGNMRYIPRYKFVYVSDLNKIKNFIENRKEEFSDNDVKKLIKMLRDHVTQ